MLTLKEKRSKWDPKAREGLFMGYEEVSKAYLTYDIEADQVLISRDVTFDKSTFGFLLMLPQDVVDDAVLLTSTPSSSRPKKQMREMTSSRVMKNDDRVLEPTGTKSDNTMIGMTIITRIMCLNELARLKLKALIQPSRKRLKM